MQVTIKGLDSTGPAGSPAGPIGTDNDGGPSGLTLSNSVKLVPIAPAPVAAQILADAAGGQQVDASVTLPFGLFAVIRDPQTTFTVIQPSFPGGLKGGLQIRLTPPERLGLIDNPADPGFLGFASTHGLPYGAGILGSIPANTFNGQFGQIVPLLRYDFSGYGASLFSDWRKSKPVGTQIIKAQFDVLVGRTSVEVVQIQSFICPWGIRVVRTITLDRKNSGGVLRHDSGWQPAGDGRLELPWLGPSPSPFVPHLGPLAVVTAVHSIREVGQPFTLGTPRHWETRSRRSGRTLRAAT